MIRTIGALTTTLAAALALAAPLAQAAPREVSPSQGPRARAGSPRADAAGR
jgi:hypothetical protein